MENKNLVVAIVAVFVLIIIVGAFFLFTREDEVSESPIQSTTVNSLVQTCDSWCNAVQINDWCDFELSAGENLAKGSCYGFANSPLYTQLGVKKCSTIDCNNRPEVDNTCVSGLGGVWDTPNSEDQCSSINGIIRFVVAPTDEPQTPEQVCCVE
ncbi:MAG: hypothetical protein KJ905_00475 [Nanoarchaeota archaeon]|nr:hypothetical protein [Nanoarchaeota archaeon]MBU1501235.1 hypothetical protein [Nanoarchaeota archaeon]